MVEPRGLNPTEGFEVAFLPWLGWEREIAVGPVRLLSFRLEDVTDPMVREYLARYFPRYTEVDGSPLRNLVFARQEGVGGFRYHTDAERITLRRAAAIVAFSAITEAWAVRIVHHNEIPVPSADSFQLLFQCFAAGSNFVDVKAGRAHHTWPIDEVMFTRPWAASAVFGGPDPHSVEALSKLLQDPGDIAPDFVQRVWQAVEWFRLAHLDGAEQSDEAKLVTMAIAFESLLALPDFGKQVEFATNVQTLVRDNEMGRGVRVKRSGEQLGLSLSGCWAWDFYEVRSRLVHGDAVPSSALVEVSGMPYLVVADLVFRECLLPLCQYG